MADEPITLEFLARQQQHVLEEIGVMRDDMQVLTAMVMRLDGTVGLVLTELRAMHSQHQRLANRALRSRRRSRSSRRARRGCSCTAEP
jgi:hypothetical protein